MGNSRSNLGSVGVTGLGGVFLKANDPAANAAWYRARLGIEFAAGGGALFKWREREAPEVLGATILGLFSKSSDYFGPGPQQAMLNFRVADLERLICRLEAAGVACEQRIEDYGYGRFSWIFDPEGNKIELWQPYGGIDPPVH